MNRLIVTLMLIVAMALGLTKLAHADDATADQTTQATAKAKAKAKAAAKKAAADQKAKDDAAAAQAQADADAKAAADAPVQVLTVNGKANGGSYRITRRSDGTLEGVTTVDNCEQCTNHITMTEFDDSFKEIAKSAKTANQIKEAAEGSITDQANTLIANEKLRVKLQKQLDDKIAACEVSDKSTVDVSGDRPRLNIVKFDNSWDGSGSSPRDHKDRFSDDEPTSGTQANVQIPTSIDDDVDHIAFTKKDECRDERLNDPTVSAEAKQKLLASALTEWSQLDEQAQKGMLAPGSKEAIRYQALQGYLKVLGAKSEFKAFAANFMQQQALKKNQDILMAANAAGGSSQAALNARINGDLSQASIAHFKSLIDMGSTFGGAQAFSQFNLSNLNRLVTTIDKSAAKTSSNGTSDNDMYAQAYKAGGGSDIYASALKTANGIYERYTREGMGAETGKLETSYNPADLSALDPRAVSRPARFAPRSTATSTLNCANATAWSPTLNTGNVVANSVPQSCQTQTGQNLGVTNYQPQVTTPNYQTASTTSSGFSIPNR